LILLGYRALLRSVKNQEMSWSDKRSKAAVIDDLFGFGLFSLRLDRGAA
jgi:hypothetical protein